jgi:hypothetical protein
VSADGEGRSSRSRAAIVRRAIASVTSLGMSTTLAKAVLPHTTSIHRWDWVSLLAWIAAPALAAAAIWSRPVGLQLMARAFWWVHLLYATVAAIIGVHDRHVLALALGSGCALLSVGRLGLAQDDGRFRPVAFRGTLMLALILAMADAGTFSWIGLMEMAAGEKVRFILFAPPMIAAVIGLLQLRTWGLLVSIACNVIVAVLAGTGVLHLSAPIRGLFVGNAIVQLLIPLPMWITIIRRRPPPPDRWQNARAIGATVVIVALAAVAISCTLFGTHPIAD